MRLANTISSDIPLISVFETIAGETFRVARLPIIREEEVKAITGLQNILKYEGLL